VSPASFPVECAWRVEMEFSLGVWTNIRLDVVAEEPIRWNRGNSANGPKDRMAQPGLFEFSLRNDAGNLWKKQGAYSLGHANCLSGFTYGIHVRVVATYAAVDYTLWRGRLRTIDPDPGLYRNQRTHCTAQDAVADLVETKVRGIAPQVNQTEDQLLTAALAGVSADAQPTATSFDAGLDVVPFAFDNIADGIVAWSAITDAVVSALGWCYVKGDGTLVYENRHTRALKASAHTFNGDVDGDAISVPNSLAGVYNRVRVTYHPKTVDSAATTVLYAATSPSAVAPGQPVTVWGTYRDPANTVKLVGGTSLVDGVLTTADYTANSASDGSGVDLSASVTVTATGYASSVKFVITNSAMQVAYVTPQIRGKGIYDNAPQTVESFVAESYGDRPVDLDLPFQNSGTIAQDMADYIRNVYDTRRTLNAFAFKANKSPRLMQQALTREIGDVITVSESVTGTSSVKAAIHGVQMAVTGGVWLGVRWALVPQDDTPVFVLDDAVLGVLDTGVLGYA
jgi:hypothetical protein